MALAELQASLTVTLARTLGTIAWQVSAALVCAMAEQLIVGSVVSVTVKVVEQEALLPAASVAVTVIVCAPKIGRASGRERGESAVAVAALQETLTVTPARTVGTIAGQVPSALDGAMAGELIVG